MLSPQDLVDTYTSHRGFLRDAARWAPIPLRLIVGYGFIAHGYAKLEKGPDAFVHIVQRSVFLFRI